MDMKTYTIQQFRERFPNEDACLDYLFQKQYGELTGCPHCAVESKFKRVKNRRSYVCPTCSHQIYPTVGTIFEKTTTPLTLWFYAMYLFSTTRNGVAAKELERQLGVSYKTALRMAHQIKTLMMENSHEKLSGEVTVDEVYLGQLGKNMHAYKKKQKHIVTGIANKIGVMTLMHKESGRVITQVLGIETGSDEALREIVERLVEPESTVVTDAYPPYKKLGQTFAKHVRIQHKKREYVKDGYTTNTNENWNSTLKRMIKGTHIHVSHKHLPKYVAENNFRYMNRSEPEKMFEKILARVA